MVQLSKTDEDLVIAAAVIGGCIIIGAIGIATFQPEIVFGAGDVAAGASTDVAAGAGFDVGIEGIEGAMDVSEEAPDIPAAIPDSDDLADQADALNDGWRNFDQIKNPGLIQYLKDGTQESYRFVDLSEKSLNSVVRSTRYLGDVDEDSTVLARDLETHLSIEGDTSSDCVRSSGHFLNESDISDFDFDNFLDSKPNDSIINKFQFKNLDEDTVDTLKNDEEFKKIVSDNMTDLKYARSRDSLKLDRYADKIGYRNKFRDSVSAIGKRKFNEISDISKSKEDTASLFKQCLNALSKVPRRAVNAYKNLSDDEKVAVKFGLGLTAFTVGIITIDKTVKSPTI
jgi:hypothetical protein